MQLAARHPSAIHARISAAAFGAWLAAASVLLQSCSPSASTVGEDRSGLEWRDRVFSLIVTDRFDNGDPSNDNANGAASPANPDGVHGGDLRGIERRLPYLRSLGITAIWITPVQMIMPGAYHGYWIRDFLQVDPRLGTMEDLRRLIRKAHEAGIAVFLDIVCNHTGPMSSPRGGAHAWSDAGYELVWNDPEVLPSPAFFRDLSIYHNHGDVKEWRDPYQILGELAGGLDDLATERPDVRAKLIEIWSWWLEQTGCDGFRVDTVKHVEADFWYEFLAGIRAKARECGRPRFFVFGEVFDFSDAKCASYTHADSLGRRGFDAVLNFSLSGSIRNAFAQGHGIADIVRSIRNLAEYDSTARTQLPVFVDNHDIPRFMHLAQGDTSRLARALTFLFALEGIPVLYYGTEQAFLGGTGDGMNREDLFDGAWKGLNPHGDGFDTTSAMYRLIQRLADARRRNEVLRRGATTLELADEKDSILVLQRMDVHKRAFIVCNLSARDANVDLPTTRVLHEWLSDERPAPQAGMQPSPDQGALDRLRAIQKSAETSVPAAALSVRVWVEE